MVIAEYTDKNRIVDILTKAFDNNKSVNYIIKQDKRRKQRIRRLMDYSFEICYRFGKVYISDDRNACALIVLPDMKKVTLKAIILDLKLVLFSIGITNIKKAMVREAKIKSLQLKKAMYYLWFIGVDPKEQGKGIGSVFLNQIIEEAQSENRIICLETSTLKNIPWYQKFGFSVYSEVDLGYMLFFLKRN